MGFIEPLIIVNRKNCSNNCEATVVALCFYIINVVQILTLNDSWISFFLRVCKVMLNSQIRRHMACPFTAVRKADVCQINPKQALPVVYYDRSITLLFTCGTLFLLYICHIAVFYVCLYVLGKHLKLLWSKEEITVHNSTIIVCILI